MTDLDAAADNYRAALFALQEADANRTITYAAHKAAGSDRTRTAHYQAATISAQARRHLEHTADQLVAAALQHTCQA